MVLCTQPMGLVSDKTSILGLLLMVRFIRLVATDIYWQWKPAAPMVFPDRTVHSQVCKEQTYSEGSVRKNKYLHTYRVHN